MQICILALWSDSLTYTMAKALAFCGHQVVVWIADVKRDGQSEWSLSNRISAIPGASVVADVEAQVPETIERLIVQGHPLLLNYSDTLDRLAAQAACLTAVSCGDRNRGYRQAMKIQWRERRWYSRWMKKLDRIAYKDGFYPIDLFVITASRYVVGFDAHSHFLNNESLYQTIHAADWDADTRRPARANFLGSRDPEIRGRILDSVEPLFTRPSESYAVPDKAMTWHLFTDAQPAPLGPAEFLQVLSESDFTLAPPGYSLVTHRPVEALLRGSIPVLNENELDLYDLALEDGVNCIAVPAGGWFAAIERIIRMDESEITGMRRNIQSMVPERVAYPALARDIGMRLGVGS
jgi:hypothetical protein